MVGFLQRAGPGHQLHPPGIEGLFMSSIPDTLKLWAGLPGRGPCTSPLMLKFPPQLHPQPVVLPSLIWIWVEMARPPTPATLGHPRSSFRRAVLPEGARWTLSGDCPSRWPVPMLCTLIMATERKDKRKGDKIIKETEIRKREKKDEIGEQG